jgi:hypothetical protein
MLWTCLRCATLHVNVGVDIALLIPGGGKNTTASSPEKGDVVVGLGRTRYGMWREIENARIYRMSFLIIGFIWRVPERLSRRWR